MTPRKSPLISLALNCGSQQANNFIIIKYEQVTAEVGLSSEPDRANVPRRFLSRSHVDAEITALVDGI